METTMRKPRNFDAELKALGDKARELKTRKVQQLGELVIATSPKLSPGILVMHSARIGRQRMCALHVTVSECCGRRRSSIVVAYVRLRMGGRATRMADVLRESRLRKK
jgi:hypothetical protein